MPPRRRRHRDGTAARAGACDPRGAARARHRWRHGAAARDHRHAPAAVGRRQARDPPRHGPGQSAQARDRGRGRHRPGGPTPGGVVAGGALPRPRRPRRAARREGRPLRPRARKSDCHQGRDGRDHSPGRRPARQPLRIRTPPARGLRACAPRPRPVLSTTAPRPGGTTAQLLRSQRFADRGHVLLLAARQRLAPAKDAEGDAARRHDRERLKHAERGFVLHAGARHDADAAPGLHDHLHGLDVVGDRHDVGPDAKIGEQRQHDLPVADRELAHDDRLGHEAANVDRLA